MQGFTRPAARSVGRTGGVGELALADLGAPRQELAHQRPVEDLLQGAADHGVGALGVADLVGQCLERVEPFVVHVRHDPAIDSGADFRNHDPTIGDRLVAGLDRVRSRLPCAAGSRHADLLHDDIAAHDHRGVGAGELVGADRACVDMQHRPQLGTYRDGLIQ